jgi:hypothetical protein
VSSNLFEVGDDGGRLGCLGGADAATDAGVGAPHQRRGGRRRQVGRPVRLGDDHQPTRDRGGFQTGIGQLGEVPRHGFVGGR